MARVLIVNHDIVERILLRSILSRADYETAEAFDAFDALDILKHDSQFDLIITEIALPRMSGLSLLNNLQEHYSRIPVIVVSAQPQSEREPEVLRRGAFAYLQKPFRIWELTDMAGQAIGLAQIDKYPLQVFLG
jgi:DNA-binding NtrC family response regulator